MNNAIELSDVIDQLRLELQVLRNKVSDERSVQFSLEGVEVELHVAVSRQTNSGGKIQFFVLEAGVGQTGAHTETQIIRLRMKPAFLDGSGNPATENLIGR